VQSFAKYNLQMDLRKTRIKLEKGGKKKKKADTPHIINQMHSSFVDYQKIKATVL